MHTQDAPDPAFFAMLEEFRCVVAQTRDSTGADADVIELYHEPCGWTIGEFPPDDAGLGSVFATAKAHRCPAP